MYGETYITYLEIKTNQKINKSKNQNQKIKNKKSKSKNQKQKNKKDKIVLNNFYKSCKNKKSKKIR